MSYSTSNQPYLIAQGVGGGRKVWFYASVDAATLVRVSGYFTDGWKLGMRAGDLVIQVDTDAAPITMQLMIVVSATSTAVDLSDGLAVTETDSD